MEFFFHFSNLPGWNQLDYQKMLWYSEEGYLDNKQTQLLQRKFSVFGNLEPLCCASSEVTVSQVFANESVSYSF